MSGSGRAAPPDTRRRRVLFVEDEAQLLEAYRRYFGGRYEVGCAGTGAEALAQFAAFAPDVVVMDLHLPDTDGIEVVRRMRERCRDLPVVITSAYGSLLPVVELLGIAHSGYLLKPFGLDQLAACIDAAC
jgi:DNA-binding response OmpR family regulator